MGVDGEWPALVVSLHNLELSLPPMSQKGKKGLLLITKKLMKHLAFLFLVSCSAASSFTKCLILQDSDSCIKS